MVVEASPPTNNTHADTQNATDSKQLSKTNPDTHRIELGHLTQHNIKQLRLINQAVFPISYTENFYSDLLKNPNLSRLAYFNDIVVGAVSYRIESPQPNSVGSQPASGGDKSVKKCYIMTLGCLAPYRNLGIGTVMVNHVLEFCKNYQQQHPGVLASIYLHVHVSNEAAVLFYQRFGFSVTGQVEGYYRHLEPQSAFVLEKCLLNDNSNGSS